MLFARGPGHPELSQTYADMAIGNYLHEKKKEKQNMNNHELPLISQSMSNTSTDTLFFFSQSSTNQGNSCDTAGLQ